MMGVLGEAAASQSRAEGQRPSSRLRRTLSDSGTSAVRRCEPSRQLGRYLLLELLGRGGMGEVYRAYDPNLDRMVALKRLHSADPESDRARPRLLREAQVAARLCHTNVVQIFDVGTDPSSNDAYIAMELVEGETLRAWLRRPHPWQEIAAVFSKVGRGLLAAHGRGVVHRDFKPDNVLLGLDGEPKVVDFGLAKPSRDARPTRSSAELAKTADTGPAEPLRATDEDMPIHQGANALTPQGARVGTPAYMPPEQMRSQPTDPRSDQYAFAVSLYEALTGQLPFEGSSSSKYGMAVLDGRVRPFPRRSPVPRRLRAAILRAISYRPADRFRSLEPLLSAIDRALVRPRVGPVALAAAAGAVLGAAAATWAW